VADSTFGILEVLLLGARAFGIFAAFAAFAWALMRMRRENSEQLDRVLLVQQELITQNQALAEKLAALTTLVITTPRRAEPLSDPEPAPPPRLHVPRRDTAPRSYETAKRLARSGASVEEIVASSGVPGTEARLLHRLHGGALTTDTRRDHAA
jgi:hypothetical protein